jgi:hypothetical protein
MGRGYDARRNIASGAVGRLPPLWALSWLYYTRHSRASGNLSQHGTRIDKIPAFAGMTESNAWYIQSRL